jgi:hypothetical protein
MHAQQISIACMHAGTESFADVRGGGRGGAEAGADEHVHVARAADGGPRGLPLH